MWASLLANPPYIALALKGTEATVIAGPGPVALPFDRNPTSDRFRGFRQEAALVIDQQIIAPRKAEGDYALPTQNLNHTAMVGNSAHSEARFRLHHGPAGYASDLLSIMQPLGRPCHGHARRLGQWL